jgi:hypothetical protein
VGIINAQRVKQEFENMLRRNSVGPSPYLFDEVLWGEQQWLRKAIL